MVILIMWILGCFSSPCWNTISVPLLCAFVFPAYLCSALFCSSLYQHWRHWRHLECKLSRFEASESPLQACCWLSLFNVPHLDLNLHLTSPSYGLIVCWGHWRLGQLHQVLTSGSFLFLLFLLTMFSLLTASIFISLVSCSSVVSSVRQWFLSYLTSSHLTIAPVILGNFFYLFVSHVSYVSFANHSYFSLELVTLSVRCSI
jgi:hypothetical protein